MQTYADMQAEVDKLSPSQRAAMQRVCGTSKLDALFVVQRGWKTKVSARTRGFTYHVTLGPKGRVVKKTVHEA